MIKIKLTLSIILELLLVINTSNAQNIDFEWVKQMGGSNTDIGWSVSVDAFGNVHTTGNFEDTVDFDPGLGILNFDSPGSNVKEIYIQKLNAIGNLEWAGQMNGIVSNYSVSIVTDDFGNIYTTGEFQKTVDFDPGPDTFNLTGNVGGSDIFVQKLDALGNFLWVKQMGGNRPDGGRGLSVDASGNVYITGYFNGTADFDPGPDTFNLSNGNIYNDAIFIQKLDASGNLVWVKRIGGDLGMDNGLSLTLDSLGNIYITGNFEEVVDFDPGPGIFNLSSSGSFDIFVLKLDNEGNFIWAKGMGGIDHDFGWSIAVDASGNVYTTGEFHETIDADPGTGTLYFSSAGFDDVFIQKLDSSGNLVWAKQIGSIKSDDCKSIALDYLGNVYITGSFRETVDFDPGPGTFNLSPFGILDSYILKLDASGNFEWVKQIGGTNINSTNYAESFSMHIDVDGNLYVTGYFGGTVDFDPGVEVFDLTSVGHEDIFVLKLSQCLLEANITSDQDFEICAGEIINIMVDMGTNYSWNTGDTSASILVMPASTTDYIVTVSNSIDCFSSDTVTVVVNNLPEINISGIFELCPGDTTLLSVNGGESYFWSTGEIENEIQLSPTNSGSYSVTVTDINDCSAIDSIDIIIDESFCPPCPTFGIPNVFTPDSDQVNDFFFIFSDEEFEIVDFKIYSRWGNLVHSSIEPWDGTYKGELVPSDVYIYMIVVETFCEKKQFRGDVTLIR